jgi:CubicO group peptidase (beta-lactamase class C family)
MRMRAVAVHLCLSLGLLAFGINSVHADAPRQAAVSAPAADETGVSAQGIKALEAYVEERIKSGIVPGAVVHLSRHGKTALDKAYGARSFGGEAMALDAIFRAYSMTKPVTGLAMMILHEEGKWQLDEPITKYLPELAGMKVFKEADADAKMILEDQARPATMRELMSNSAGFAYGIGGPDPVSKAYENAKLFQRRDLAELVAGLAQLPLAYQPGKKWQYSIVSDLQGYVIEKLSGQSLDVFFKTRIFEPLGMKDTGFFVPAENAARLLPVYALDPETKTVKDVSHLAGDYLKSPTLFSGGAGLVTTAHDFARFGQALLNGGELDGVRIAKAETIKLMGSNFLPEGVWITAPGVGTLTGLGYGAAVSVMVDPTALKSPQGVGTFGWGGAAGTNFWVDPANGVVFVWMIQRFGMSDEFRPELTRLVYEALE